MSLEQAFVADIAEHPEDDAPRLIYADWLEENGQAARAEFIRLHCQLARMPSDDSRISEVLAQCRRVRPLIEECVPGRLGLRRGMAEKVCEIVSLRQFLAEANDLFYRHPIREIGLWIGADEEEEVEAVARCSHLRRLHRLILLDSAEPTQSSRRVRQILGSANLVDLRRLVMDLDSVEAEFLPWMLGLDQPSAPGYRQLEGLSLEAPCTCALSGDAIEMIGRSPLLENLAHLELRGVEDLTVNRLSRLVESPFWASLHSWELKEMGPANPDLWQLLVRSLPQSPIRHLGLDWFMANNEEAFVESLTQAQSWGSLESLRLVTDLNGEPLRRLTRCSHLTGLKSLALDFSARNHIDLEHLGNCPFLGRLETLRLGVVHSTDIGGLAALISNARKMKPIRFELKAHTIGDIELVALANSSFTDRLRTLSLDAMALQLSDAALHTLARSRGLGQLHTLRLGRIEGVSAQAVAALLRSETTPYLSAVMIEGWIEVNGPSLRELLADDARPFQINETVEGETNLRSFTVQLGWYGCLEQLGEQVSPEYGI